MGWIEWGAFQWQQTCVRLFYEPGKNDSYCQVTETISCAIKALSAVKMYLMLLCTNNQINRIKHLHASHLLFDGEFAEMATNIASSKWILMNFFSVSLWFHCFDGNVWCLRSTLNLQIHDRFHVNVHRKKAEEQPAKKNHMKNKQRTHTHTQSTISTHKRMKFAEIHLIRESPFSSSLYLVVLGAHTKTYVYAQYLHINKWINK